ncbi:hypothetical protein BTVI_08845 [Pitangus sulphuratus]|nr:hypothetical protein BTVI_08845 [Pitangus sulphuratus]
MKSKARIASAICSQKHSIGDGTCNIVLCIMLNMRNKRKPYNSNKTSRVIFQDTLGDNDEDIDYTKIPRSLTQWILTCKVTLLIALLIDFQSADLLSTVLMQSKGLVLLTPEEATPLQVGTKLSTHGTAQCEKPQLSVMKYHIEEVIWNNKKSELLKGSEKNQIFESQLQAVAYTPQLQRRHAEAGTDAS